MRFSRSDRSLLAIWWFTVDRVFLGAVMVLFAVGIVLSLAASPAVAVRQGFGTFHYVERHIAFSAAGFVVILALSLSSPSVVRRLSLGLVAASLLALAWVLFAGPEINGARRWLFIGDKSLQPSEFVKPGLVVLLAWLFAESRLRPDMPALLLATGLGGVFVLLIGLQPDVGQAALIGLVWLALYLLSGQSLLGVAAFGGVMGGGLVAAYAMFEHVRARIDTFLFQTRDAHSQLSRAVDSFVEGGFFGRGPGEGTIKTRFPDAHNDFIFSVVAEEYGVVACLGLVILFGFIVMRCLFRAEGERRPANRLAIYGLALLFGFQALINMGVNVGLLPAKGMTLPLVSSGGSSILAVSVTLGMLAALTRRRVDTLGVAGDVADGVAGVRGGIEHR